ncbi:MAG: hypothetical protein ABII27_00890 [bacterium]
MLLAYIGIERLGMSNTNVSQILNVSNSSVRKMLQRNKKLLENYENKTIKELAEN